MPKPAAMMERLTRARCDCLQPKEKRYRVLDSGADGLAFVVEPNGRKYWVCRYKAHDGTLSEKQLGDWCARQGPDGRPAKALASVMLPDQAREAAIEVRKSVKAGVNPIEAKRDKVKAKAAAEAERARAEEERRAAAEVQAATFAFLSERYLEASRSGAFRGRAMRKAETTIAKEEHSLRKHVLPALGARPIAAISRQEVKELYASIEASSGNGSANTALEVIRRVFAYALDETTLLNFSPAVGIRVHKNPPRRTTATDAQLRLLWEVLEEAKQPVAYKREVTIQARGAGSRPNPAYATGAALQVALLTLQRRGEVATMRACDLDLERGLWTIPPEVKKERKAAVVPLSPEAKAIIEAALERSGGPYVFPDAAGEAHLMPKTMTRFMERLRKRDAKRREDAAARLERGTERAGDLELLARPPFKDVTTHDLRRTGRTKLTGEELGIDPAIAERVLSHVVGSRVQNTYDVNSYLGPKRAALNAWALELMSIVGRDEPPPPAAHHPQSASNVVQLRQAG